MTTQAREPRPPAPRDHFDAYPAATFVVDGDLRLLRANGSARVMLGEGADRALSLAERAGDALRCVQSDGEGGCGRQEACADCVLRSSVGGALDRGTVHRARAFMQLRRREERAVEVCLLVSASPVVHDGSTRVRVTLEDVSDVSLKDTVRRAEHALEESDARAASLARFPEENPDPVLRVAADSTLEYANEAARSAFAVLGLAPGEEVAPALAQLARRALEAPERLREELVCDGRTWALSFRPSETGVNVYAHDVTELRSAIDQLATEKEWLRVTLSSIGDGVIATDELARITLVNGVAEVLTGWTTPDAIGRPVEDVFHIVSEETRRRAENPIVQSLREGRIVGLANHTSLVARDGTERPVADSAAPIRDASGRIRGGVLVFRDQTREREAERALRASEQQVRRKLDAILSPDGDLGSVTLEDVIDPVPLRAMMEEFNRLSRIPLAIIDVHGKVLVGVDWQDICTRFHRVNPETCKHGLESDTTLTVGVPAGEIRRYRCKNNMWDVATPIVVGGHHLGNVFMGQFFHDDEPVDREVFRAQAERYGFDEREYLAALDRVPRLGRGAVAAGMRFFLRFAELLSRSSYGNLKLARAVADRERLMDSLRETNERLEDTDRRRTEFLAVLSHELRNPLAPICNSLFVIERAAPGSEQALRANAVVRRQVDHLKTLVDELLDVTRLSHGKIALSRKRIDLADVVRKACDDNRSTLDGASLELRVDVRSAPVWIDADATRISQVVTNLLQNAAKFTPPGGCVEVAVSAGEGVGAVVVRDTGVGIDADDLERLFEPFAQADQGLARTQGGLGLGLALVRGLVTLHGGDVRASSPGPGLGATFSVTLPLASPDASEA
jgi:PAS domain S-box-containing protein